MNENERTPAETAADYAVHFADGFFVPCPCCGKEVESPDNGFTSEKEAMEWALGACDCAGAKAWQQQRPALRMDSPCMAGKMKAGAYRQTTKRQRGPDGKWQDAPAYEYDDSGLPLGHGEKSLFLLQRLGMELTDQEAAAIRWHMGAYRDHDCYNEMGKAFERYALALFLHLADMTAMYWWES